MKVSDRGALAARLAEDNHVIGANRVEVAGARNEVVDAAEHSEQIGPHGQGVVELTGPDLVHPHAPDGEVRILQRLVLTIGDVLRQPVGPAAVATVSVGIFQSLRTGIADRHIATKCCHDPIVTPPVKINSHYFSRSGRPANYHEERCCECPS